jgi:hypothetical protein
LRPASTSRLQRAPLRYPACIKKKGALMQRLYGPLKALGYVVLALIVVAIAYATFTGIRYWDGIAV